MRFQDFFNTNFYEYEHYKGVKPDSHQPARYYGTV